MNKIIIGLGVIVLLVFGYFLINGSSVTYVAVVDEEVTQLEKELAEIDAQVLAGSLTVEEANTARAKIAVRLDAINTAVAAAQSNKLTPEQTQTLLAGLNKFKVVLDKYRATLTVIEETATIKPTLKSSRGGGSRQSIVAAVEDAIDAVEDQVTEVVEDYEPEENDSMEEDNSASTSDDAVGDTSIDSEVEVETETEIVTDDTTVDSEVESESVIELDEEEATTTN